MEFWLSDGDCPLPGSGERSLPDTPKKPAEPWQDFNDAWGGLMAAPQASLRCAGPLPCGACICPIPSQSSDRNRLIAS